MHVSSRSERGTQHVSLDGTGRRVYDIDMTVSNLVDDPHNASTQCYAIVNSSLMILGATVDGDNPSTDLKTRQLALSAGDAIDFMVNPCGTNGHDSTGLDLQISDTSAVQTRWNVYDDFSLDSGNPNGVWTYGSTPDLATNYTVTNYTTTNTVQGLDVWNPGVSDPCIGAKPDGCTVGVFVGATFPTDSVMLSPDPAPNTRCSVGPFRNRERSRSRPISSTPCWYHPARPATSISLRMRPKNSSPTLLRPGTSGRIAPWRN